MAKKKKDIDQEVVETPVEETIEETPVEETVEEFVADVETEKEDPTPEVTEEPETVVIEEKETSWVIDCCVPEFRELLGLRGTSGKIYKAKWVEQEDGSIKLYK